MKNLIQMFTCLLMFSSCTHNAFRTIPLNDYYAEITPEQRDVMVNEFNSTSRFNRSLSTYYLNPNKSGDSSFVRLEGFVVKKDIINKIMSQTDAAALKISFGQNGFDKKGLKKRPNINIILTALDSKGKKLDSLSLPMFHSLSLLMIDKIPPCPPCNSF